MEQQLMDTANAIPNQLKHGWNSPRATVIRIEALVVITAFLSFLLIFGSWRCWCRHWFIQKGVLGAYILSSLVTYTMGYMQSSAARNEMFPVWALSLLAVLGCTNSITAYSLDDNKQYIRHVIQQALVMAYVILIICSITSSLAFAAAFLLFFDTHQRNFCRILACMLVCESWNPDKQIADYMESEQKSVDVYDPVSMKGYTYLVNWNIRHMKLNATTGYKRKLVTREDAVTIDKIWQCKHGLLGSSDTSSALKDVCLSFALFQLLKRRFLGFYCAEAGPQQKTKRFVFEGLLLEGKSGYERAFKVIEVELGFLYDFFYTKYAFVHHMEHEVLAWAILTIFSICFLGAVTVIQKIRIGRSSDDIIIVNTKKEDLVITLTVLASLALLQVLQDILYWASNWGRVALACDYVHQPSPKRFANYMRRIKKFLSRFRLFDKYYWQHKLGQYSLLESYAYNSSRIFRGKTRSLPYGPSSGNHGLWTGINECLYGLKGRYRKSIIKRSPFFGVFRGKGIKGRVAGEPTKLSMLVKTAVVDTLKRTITNGHLKKGTSSLQINNISWDYQLKPDDTDAHTILIWHIATCYCELVPSNICLNENTDVKNKRDVATQLSKYCAYLLVFAPGLLPGHQWNTSELFDAVVKEARRILKGADNNYQTMKSLEDSTGTIFERGTQLGKQLESITDVLLHWKVMTDFWAELIRQIM